MIFYSQQIRKKFCKILAVDDARVEGKGVADDLLTFSAASRKPGGYFTGKRHLISVVVIHYTGVLTFSQNEDSYEKRFLWLKRQELSFR
jgi:hypothetical protein